MTQTALVPGSLAAVAQQSGQSVAESFVSADAIIIVDISASMLARDSRGGLSRWEVACQELARLQAEMPGKLALIEFSETATFVPSGCPSPPRTATNLAGALRFARIADVEGMRFFVISDGIPDDATGALAEARQYKAPISTIFVGPEDGAGRAFLARLAQAAGGQAVKAECVLELAATMLPLLQAGRP